MSRRVTVSLICSENIQGDFSLGTEKLARNYCNRLDKLIAQVLPSRPDLIVLPEACDRYNGFSALEQTDYLVASDGIVRDHLRAIAKTNNCCIAYSSISYHPEDIIYYKRNSTQIIARDGSIAGTYNKNHVTIDENELERVGYGDKAEVIKTNFGKVACAICFDLNFNELLERYIPQKPDMIVFCSQYHGGLRQEQWAYACRAHFAGAIANDQGRILNPFGETLACTTNYYNHVTYTVNLDCALAHIDYNNKRFSDAKRKYGKKLTIYDPGHVGSVLLTCEADGISVYDIMKEFEIEALDDYFTRALKHRHSFFETEKLSRI
ncbi:MAG: carbon-nitrogen hydrolase family protein [Eubacteriales bacterium]